MLATLSISLFTMKMRVQPDQKRKLWEFSAFKEKPFTLFTIGAFFGFMGLYIPFFYVQSYAIEEQIMDVNTAFYMLSILNASSIGGRILPNFIADKTGPLNVLIPGTIVASVLAFGWIGIRSTAGLVIFSILYGFSSGSFVSLPPTVLVSITPNLATLGTRMGMCFAISGLGLLVGTPIAGVLIRQASFIAAIAFGGAVVAVSAGFFIMTRIAKAGVNPKVIA